jgi:hypothetical protein
LVVGTESSTIVQPLLAGGHATRAGLGGGGGRGAVVVAVVVGAVVVGSGAIWVGTLVEEPTCVRTIVSLAELESSASQTAETTPATIATTSASSAGQIQSPGYQPRWRRQRAPSRV